MGRTPLHLAAAYGSPEVVRFMAEAPNCDINARDSLGRTPLHWCLALGGWKYGQNRAEEIIEISGLLISKGASVTAVDTYGNTALHYATVLKDEQVILLIFGAWRQTVAEEQQRRDPAGQPRRPRQVLCSTSLGWRIWQ